MKLFSAISGGDHIAVLLDKLGLQENEALSHPMITKAIANAQKKLAGKVTIEQPAYSQEEWAKKNIGAIIS